MDSCKTSLNAYKVSKTQELKGALPWTHWGPQGGSQTPCLRNRFTPPLKVIGNNIMKNLFYVKMNQLISIEHLWNFLQLKTLILVAVQSIKI